MPQGSDWLENAQMLYTIMMECNINTRIKLDFSFPKEMPGKKIYTMRTLESIFKIQHSCFL